MGDINNYTENALTRQYTIRNYETQERHGVVIINYDLVNRGSGGALGFAISAPTGLGFIALSACLPIAAPVLAASVVANLFVVPTAGSALGAMVGMSNSRSHYFDCKTGELIGSTQNEASERLNEIGSRLFEDENYVEAAKYHANAFQICLNGYEREQTFNENRNNARNEVCATILNSEADRLFIQGNYSEAQMKYQQAYDASRVDNRRNTYGDNRDKAQAEINAINFNSEGDLLFNQGNYTEAERKYREAYNTSRVDNRHNTYKHQIYIVSKLQLDTLWNEAWDLENDPKVDRSSEARDTFQNIFSKCTSALELFPNNLKFKQLKTLVSLKMEGNELFNQGIDLQQSGVKLLREAQSFKEQSKYDLAHMKLGDAKNAFCNANEKFLEGRETDQRFVSCVEIVQDHIEQVITLIKNVEGIQQTSRLRNSSNDNSDNHIFSMTSESDACIRDSNCHAQI